jgi:protein arginine N-methyltransferase 5
MRYWDAPEQCDILISELLGSFGDNELSPECLDGAQKVIREGGINIPESYTAFAAPLSSVSLYNKAQLFGDRAHMETPYVVKFRDTLEIAPAKPIWKFQHPNNEPSNPPGHPDFNIHNTRYSYTTFDVTDDITMVSEF